MIRTYIIEAIASQAMPNGRYSLTLSDEQVTDLLTSLALHTASPTSEPTAQHIREFFFYKEGFMANDTVCRAYWEANHE